MLRLESKMSVDGDRTILPPRSLSEAAREAQIYALSGVPPHAQRGMTLAQALRFAQQHSLPRPLRGEVRAAFLQSLRP